MRNVPVKIKRLHPDAVIPQYATAGAAGFDLVAVKDVIIAPGETKKVPLGLAFEIPEGYEIQVRPRSGMSERTKLRISNAPGTVDADFRGEVCVLVENIAPLDDCNKHAFFPLGVNGEIDHEYTAGTLYETYLIRKGDRIAQGILAKVPRAAFVEVTELGETGRGDGGFGSTGT
ncbi:dUTP diphosphatase [Brevibacillus panacihumi]|uniref:dUTP diphosphatase n=1 Tax=Brevibacillus panacihumi TaxID=497735 RepID=UPI003CFD43B2